MKKRNALVLIVLSSLLAACGKGNGVGGFDSPLSVQQKQKFEETLESIGRTQRAIPTEGMVELGPNDDGIAPMSFDAATAADPVKDEMNRRLKESQSRNECMIGSKFVTPDPENPGIVNMVMRVSGQNCAVSLRMTSNSVVDDKIIKSHMTIKYEVFKEEFRLLNDIDGIEMNIDSTGNNWIKDESGQFNLRLDGKGTFHSQKYGTVGFTQNGDIRLTGQGDGKSGGGEMAARFTFNDMSVELKQVVKGAKTSYLINGSEVSETEYQSYFLKAGLKAAGK